MLKFLEFQTKQGNQQLAADSILYIEVVDDNAAYIYLKNANNSRIVVQGTGLEGPFVKVVQDALYLAATTNWMKPIAKVVFDGPYLGTSVETLTLQCISCKEASQ